MITHYQQAVDDLFNNRLQDTAISALKQTAKTDLIYFTFTLGGRVRVLYDMWNNPELVRSTGKGHPDSASLFIILKLWEKIQADPNIPIFENVPKITASDRESWQKAFARYEAGMGHTLSVE